MNIKVRERERESMSVCVCESMGRTRTISRVGVEESLKECVGEERLLKFTEEQLECATDHVYVPLVSIGEVIELIYT